MAARITVECRGYGRRCVWGSRTISGRARRMPVDITDETHRYRRPVSALWRAMSRHVYRDHRAGVWGV